MPATISDNEHMVNEFQSEFIPSGDFIGTAESRDSDRESQYVPDISVSDTLIWRDVVNDANIPVGNYGFEDDAITRRLHARMLNVYRDKRHNLRCGSLILTGPLAACVACGKSLSANALREIMPSLSEREIMEAFTTLVICHAENHNARGGRIDTAVIFENYRR